VSNPFEGKNESDHAAIAAIGKTIAGVRLDTDNGLFITFEDRSVLRLWDDGQDCCEARYMSSDDVPQQVAHHVGAKLLGYDFREAPDIESGDDGGDVHEVAFFAIKTERGEIVVQTHNEHNGYYGGLSVSSKWEPEQEPSRG
jgi:hypothetical protein